MTDETDAAAVGAALYEAFRQTEQAPDPGRLLSSPGFRRDFMTAFQRVAISVIEHNGPATDEQKTLLSQIFYLDPLVPPLDPSDSPDVEVMLGVQYLVTCAALVDAANRSLGHPGGASNNAVIQALDAIVRVLIGVTSSSDLSGKPGSDVIARIAASLPAEPEAAPVSTTASPFVAIPDEGASDEASSPAARPLVSVPCPARLRVGETCVAVSNAVLFQEKNVVARVRYAGLSGRFRIMRGVSYRMGDYALGRTLRPTTERIAAGTLCITDARVIFLSSVRNLELAYSSLLDTSTGPSEIRLARSNSGQFVLRDVGRGAVVAFEQMSGTSSDPRIMTEAWTFPAKPQRTTPSEMLGRALGLLFAIGLAFYAWRSFGG